MPRDQSRIGALKKVLEPLELFLFCFVLSLVGLAKQKHEQRQSDDVFSRPGRSPGLLYKHCCSYLIKWFTH